MSTNPAQHPLDGIAKALTIHAAAPTNASRELIASLITAFTPDICSLIENRNRGQDDSLEMVREFHDAFGIIRPDSIDISRTDLNELRIRLQTEELCETERGLELQNVVEVLDGLADQQYVLDGTFDMFGLAPYKAATMREVHRSNMSKLGDDGLPI